MKIMRWIVLLVLAMFLSSCERAPEPAPTLPDVSFEVYRDGYFQVVVPVNLPLLLFPTDLI